MAALNKLQIIGNCGADPDSRYLPDGTAVTNISVGVTESYKDRSGQKVEHTEWFRVGFFGKTAEVAGEYLRKGSLVYVEGSLKTRKYTDKEGIERYVTEVRGDRLQMLGSRNDNRDDRDSRDDSRRASSNQRRDEPRRERDEPRREAPQQRGGSGGAFDDFDSDIPF